MKRSLCLKKCAWIPDDSGLGAKRVLSPGELNGTQLKKPQENAKEHPFWGWKHQPPISVAF
jgi:hypothetical protein